MSKPEWASTLAGAGAMTVLALASAWGAQSKPAAAPAQTPPEAAEAAAPAGFVGMETCAQCHEEVATKFKTTPHVASSLQCEGCHGPGQAHVENAGDKTKIRVFKDLSNVESSGTCMECHNKGNRSTGRARCTKAGRSRAPAATTRTRRAPSRRRCSSSRR